MSQRITIWHNPRCSKSRKALALLEDRGLEIEVRRYLDQPPTEAEIEDLLEALSCPPLDLVRQKEAAFVGSGLSSTSSARDVARAIADHPALLERPVVVVGRRAVIGRPPETVLDLL